MQTTIKFKALYPTDAKSYNALLEDGTLVRLHWTGANNNAYEVIAIPVEDKRPPEPKRPTMFDDAKD